MLIFLASVMKLDDRIKYSLVSETDFHSLFNSLIASISSKDTKTAQTNANNLLNALNSYKNAAKYNKTEIEKASAGLKSILGSLESGDFTTAKTTANGLTVYGHINGIFGKEAPTLAKLQQGKQQPNAFAQIDKLMKSANEKHYSGNAGSTEAALEDYTKAIALLEKLPESKEKTEKLITAYSNRGDVQYNLIKYKDAIADYTSTIKIIEKLPESKEKTKKLAMAYGDCALSKFCDGDYKGAITDYDKAIKLALTAKMAFNEIFNLYDYRVTAKMRLKDYKGAIADYNEYLAWDPGGVLCYVSRGYAQYLLKNYKDALADYNRAIKWKPDYAEAYTKRGDCYTALGMKKEAEADYNKAKELTVPKKPEKQQQQPNKQQQQPKLTLEQDVFKTCEEIINGFKQKKGMLSQLKRLEEMLNTLKNDKKYAESAGTITTMLNDIQSIRGAVANEYYSTAAFMANHLYTKAKETFMSIDTLLKSALAKAKLSDYKGSIDDYTKAIKLLEKQPAGKGKDEKLTEAYLNRGNAQYSLKNYKDAITNYEKAFITSTNAGGYYLDFVLADLGAAKYSLKNYKGAIADYTKAIKLREKQPPGKERDKRLIESYLIRATSQSELGQYNDAIADYNRALKLDPTNTGFYILRADAQYNLKKYKDAIADYDRALKRDPSYTGVYHSRGNAKYELKDYKGALADYKRMAVLDAYEYNSHGYTEAKLGDLEKDGKSKRKYYADAIADYNEAIRLKPDFAFAYNNRGYAKAMLGDYAGGLADCNKSLSLDPDNEEAYRNRSICYAKLGMKKEAAEDLKKYQELSKKK